MQDRQPPRHPAHPFNPAPVSPRAGRLPVEAKRTRRPVENEHSRGPRRFVSKHRPAPPQSESGRVQDAVMDMSAGFAADARLEAVQARVTYDKFHVVSHLNKAVDVIRRTEHKALPAQGDETLKGQRMLFLFNPENFSEEQAASFDLLLKSNLKVSWFSVNVREVGTG